MPRTDTALPFSDQSDYRVRFEWGLRGLDALCGRAVDEFVIVDVLSFSTCVSVAVDGGAEVFPFRWPDAGVDAYAAERGASIAGSRSDPDSRFSLSPPSMRRARPGDRIVVPSPNGSALSLEAAAHGEVLAGCLRNRTAVAGYLARRNGSVAVIAAGERWPDGSARVALEDLLGAGSIIALLPGSRSPEAEAAAAAFEHARPRLRAALETCSSGRELIERGFGADVAVAAELDTSRFVPVLTDGRYSAGGD